MFIIDDERDDVMAKAFLYYNDSTYMAIIIVERMNFLKAHVEV